MFRKIAGRLAALFIVSAATPVWAGTYTLTRTLTGPDGVTGTATFVLDDSTLGPDASVGSKGGPPAALVDFSATLSNLGHTPTTTTFSRSHLEGFGLERDGNGELTDLNFWVFAPNTDGYTLDAVGIFTSRLEKDGYQVEIVNSAAAALPEPVPTLTEWAMILLGLTLAGGAALMIQRRRLIA